MRSVAAAVAACARSRNGPTLMQRVAAAALRGTPGAGVAEPVSRPAAGLGAGVAEAVSRPAAGLGAGVAAASCAPGGGDAAGVACDADGSPALLDCCAFASAA